MVTNMKDAIASIDEKFDEKLVKFCESEVDGKLANRDWFRDNAKHADSRFNSRGRYWVITGIGCLNKGEQIELERRYKAGGWGAVYVSSTKVGNAGRGDWSVTLYEFPEPGD
jgi:hypothetical protein